MKRKKHHNPVQKYKHNKISAAKKSENNLSAIHAEAVQNASQEKFSARATATVRAEMYQGPYLPAPYVDIYEQHCPGFLHRLLIMAEKAQDGQNKRDDKLIDHEIEDAKRGMFYGFIAFIVLVISTLICTLTGHEWVAGGLAGMSGLGMLRVIGQFIGGRSSKPKATKTEPETEAESLPTAQAVA